MTRGPGLDNAARARIFTALARGMDLDEVLRRFNLAPDDLKALFREAAELYRPAPCCRTPPDTCKRKPPATWGKPPTTWRNTRPCSWVWNWPGSGGSGVSRSFWTPSWLLNVAAGPPGTAEV